MVLVRDVHNAAVLALHLTPLPFRQHRKTELLFRPRGGRERREEAANQLDAVWQPREGPESDLPFITLLFVARKIAPSSEVWT